MRSSLTLDKWDGQLEPFSEERRLEHGRSVPHRKRASPAAARAEDSFTLVFFFLAFPGGWGMGTYSSSASNHGRPIPRPWCTCVRIGTGSRTDWDGRVRFGTGTYGSGWVRTNWDGNIRIGTGGIDRWTTRACAPTSPSARNRLIRETGRMEAHLSTAQPSFWDDPAACRPSPAWAVSIRTPNQDDQCEGPARSNPTHIRGRRPCRRRSSRRRLQPPPPLISPYTHPPSHANTGAPSWPSHRPSY